MNIFGTFFFGEGVGSWGGRISLQDFFFSYAKQIAVALLS